MKQLLKLSAAALICCATGAQAADYQLDFTASGFGPGLFSNLAAPQSPISGSFVFSAPSLGAAITSINAVNLVIAGHSYTLPEVSFGAYGDGYLFGAKSNGVGMTMASTDDFYLIVSSSLNVLTYAQQGVFDTWSTGLVAVSYGPLVSPVPEPGKTATLLAGLAALGLLRARRQRTTRLVGATPVSRDQPKRAR